ncbi:hypothetical protein F5X68DRAFT_206462 [Plectosphaerella plurivora]|uniref:Uncharacterized protein n=1 Tax=Plectosphaerella plurivora TaxID=936078 RepID=A0A9P8VC90_9PEZI|nr:hypothetical protein F5X68DRAFT_206462 [Plectosphaerella plurivora]
MDHHVPQQCPRCEVYFTQEAIYAHLRQEIPCQVSYSHDNPDVAQDDGIRFFHDTLMGRDVYGWDDLWRFLFPQDEVTPPPTLVPLVEIHEVDIQSLANKLSAKLSIDGQAQISEEEIRAILSEQFRVATASRSSGKGTRF